MLIPCCDYWMHQKLLNITEQQKTFLFDRKKELGIDVSVQIREAIDDYAEKHGGYKK